VLGSPSVGGTADLRLRRSAGQGQGSQGG